MARKEPVPSASVDGPAEDLPVAAPAAPVAPPPANPSAGGSYLQDVETGALTRLQKGSE